MKRKSQSPSFLNSKIDYNLIRWDIFDALTNEFKPTRVPECEYRYDKDNNVLYKLTEQKNAMYTYIAKADGLDIYKIGHTSNLARRMKELSFAKPYSYLRLKAVAFSFKDIERPLLLSIGGKTRLPAPYDKVKELAVLKLTDVLSIIKRGGFMSLDCDGRLPGQLTRFCRFEYDAEDGHFLRVHNGFNVKYEEV